MMPTIQQVPPGASAPQFDERIARSLAEFCRRSYLPDPCADKVGSSSVTLVGDRTSTLVMVEDIGDAIVLTFKGTQEPRDWLTDAEFIKASLDDHSGIKIHRGFLAAIDDILPKIVALLLPAGADKASVKSLIITGHSLGGALASLAAWFLQEENFPIRYIYTFASPRVGNAAWRTAYDRLLRFKTFRVAAAADLVPLVPGIFCPPFDGYRHVGQEVFLNGNRAIVDPSHYFELAEDSWMAYRAFQRGDIDFILAAHSIENDYIRHLDNLIKAA